MESFASLECMPFLQLLLLLFLCIDVCSSQPISFNSTIPFNKTTQSQTLWNEDGNLFFWPLHEDPAIFNLSLPSNDSTLGSYHSVSSAYLGYVSSDKSEPTYVLSVVIIGEEGGYPEDGMIVWMANQDNPIRGADPTLAINHDGRLVLYVGDKEPVWRTNATGDRLELRGDGNLLLYDDVRQFGAVVWQSFDDPKDTWVVGQVIRQGTHLMSRVSASDLSRGTFSLLIDEHLDFFFLYAQDGNPNFVCYEKDQGNITCAIGLIGCVVFDFIEGFSASFYCDKYCNNSRRPSALALNSSTSSSQYITSWPISSMSKNVTPIIRLSYIGDFLIFQYDDQKSYWSTSFSYTNKGSSACRLPGHCGPYSTCFPLNNTCSSTCITDAGKSCMLEVRTQLPSMCQNPHYDKWEMGSVVGRFYMSSYCEEPLNVTNPNQCRDICHQNCSCTASFYDPYQSGCYLVTHKLLHLIHNDNSSYLAFIKMPSSKSNNHVFIIVVSLVSTLILSSIIIVVLIIVKKRRKPRDNVGHSPNEEEDDLFRDALHTITKFSYEEIEAITNGFCTKLGSGGFGSVYDGLLVNGQKVAVKRLDSVSGQGSKEFRAEVAIMAGIHHRNLVELLGFCVDTLHRLLVYEHMPFGSLDRWLFNTNEENEALLTWPQRFKIAVGIANGLAYLHEECTKKIIHLDVKPQNILLDHNFDAKVGDFGLSRLLGREESFVVTTMRGTPGYLAPEWLREGGVTEKMDIYSFGMVLLELVSGRKNYDVQLIDSEKRYFPVWAFDKLKEGKERELLDPKLAHQLLHNKDSGQDHEQGQDNDDDVMQFKRTIHVAFLCVQEQPQCRPRMSDVAKMLEGGQALPPLPPDRDMRGFLRSRTIMSPTNSVGSMSYSMGTR